MLKKSSFKQPFRGLGFSVMFIVCFFTAELLNAQTNVTVNANTQYQTTEGWGTSLCWFGNVIGRWSDPNRNAIADLLFDPGKGLGLNLVRYNIGGGDNPSHNHMGYGKEMEGFKDSATASYNWNADPGQRWMLQAAKSRIAADEFVCEAFSNSPPYWMTNSGCASGANGGGNNLKSDYYDDFADYLTEVVKHFRDSWGITFRTLEPMNEPMIGWGANGGQEGCHFDRNLQPNIIREVRNSLVSKGLTAIRIAAPDETSIDDTVTTYNSYDSTTRSYIYQINTHVYHGSNRSGLKQLAVRDGKKLWQSECDGSGAPAPFDQFTHNHNDIAVGLDIAQRLTRDIRDMQPDGWIFWQAVESEQAQTSLNKNWGMIHADFERGTEAYYMTKKYYTMAQYTKFIRPGYVSIDINNPDAVAFFGSAQGKLVVVQRNANTSDSSFVYNFNGFTSLGTSVAVYRTSSSENFAKLSDITISGTQLRATNKARSITTYVFSGVSTGSVTSTPTATPTPTATAPTPTPMQNPIWTGGPYTLNGTTDYVDMPDGITDNLGDISIACWVKLNSVTNWARIFDFGGDSNIFVMLTPASAETGFPYFAITTTGNSGEQGLNGTSALATGSWHHFAIVKSGNTGILYINNREEDRNTAMSLKPADLGNTLNNYIGRSQWSHDPYLSGDVDKFKIYNRAITTTEVAALYSDCPDCSTPTPPVTRGDVNGDGSVNIVDAMLIAQYAAGLNPPGFNSANADANCDSTININDALLVARYAAGLVAGLNC